MLTTTKWLSCSCTLPQARSPLTILHSMECCPGRINVAEWHCVVALLALARHRAWAQVPKREASSSCTIYCTAIHLLHLCCGASLHICTGAGAASVVLGCKQDRRGVRCKGRDCKKLQGLSARMKGGVPTVGPTRGAGQQELGWLTTLTLLGYSCSSQPWQLMLRAFFNRGLFLGP
jgi:hypothetical protein